MGRITILRAVASPDAADAVADQLAEVGLTGRQHVGRYLSVAEASMRAERARIARLRRQAGQRRPHVMPGASR